MRETAEAAATTGATGLQQTNELKYHFEIIIKSPRESLKALRLESDAESEAHLAPGVICPRAPNCQQAAISLHTCDMRTTDWPISFSLANHNYPFHLQTPTDKRTFE